MIFQLVVVRPLIENVSRRVSLELYECRGRVASSLCMCGGRGILVRVYKQLEQDVERGTNRRSTSFGYAGDGVWLGEISYDSIQTAYSPLLGAYPFI